MKYIITSIALSLAFVSASFALVNCSVTPSDPSCIGGNGNPLIVYQVWGQTGLETTTVRPGATITDQAGNSYTCNPRVDVQGCSDLTRTDYYRKQMREVISQLRSNGFFRQFPQFHAWGSI